MIDGLTTQYVLLCLTLLLIGVIAVTHIGALWLRLALIALLASMVVRRIDAIGVYYGVDLVSNSVNDLITLLSIGVILCAFLAAYRRRSYLARAERERQNDLRHKHGDRIAELEWMRVMDEHKYHHDWNTMTTHQIRSR